LKNSKEDINKI